LSNEGVVVAAADDGDADEKKEGEESQRMTRKKLEKK